jgi:hypothetical protein
MRRPTLGHYIPVPINITTSLLALIGHAPDIAGCPLMTHLRADWVLE